MEKWRSKSKSLPKTDSLLPPTRRQPDIENTSSVEKRKGKRWTIGGFLKRISHRDGGDASSSGDASSLNTPVLKRKKAKNILKNKSSRRAIRSSIQAKKDFDFEYKKGPSHQINPFIFPTIVTLPQESPYSRSSEGSLDGSNKKVRKDKIKARVEAKRDKLCTNSSTDESSNESRPQNGLKNDVCLRRRRNAKAERLIKKLCKDGENPDEKIIPENYHEVKNPLVRQTLQYFENFDKNNDRERKKINSHRRQTQQIFPISLNNCDVAGKKSRSQEDIYLSRVPNFEARVSPQICNTFVPHDYASSLDSYYRSPRIDYKKIDQIYHSGNQFDDTGIYSRIRSPSQRSENSCLNSTSPDIDKSQRYLQNSVNSRDKQNSTKDKHLRKSVVNGKYENDNFRNDEVLLKRDFPSDKYLYKHTKEETSVKDDKVRRGNERRSSKNLEEALCELEEIYNSLQLGDEDLLERAEKRSMEEYSNKKMENILSDLEQSMNSVNTTRKVEVEPNILKDDMAFRRLRSANRPSSDGHAILSNISYLVTSPILTQRDYVDPRQKPRRKEPDVTLDDVVFRNLHHAKNSLKVIEPQPPFGIPLGPITGATESDYLHTKFEPRTSFIPRNEPDIVADDLAFRNLRKDKNSNKNEKHSWERPSNFVAKKKRAVRSLSANLYSLINRKESPDDPERNESPQSELEYENLDINGNQSQLKTEVSSAPFVEEDVKISEESGKDLGPFTEQEILVYRQLCQELENLVESTTSGDKVSDPVSLEGTGVPDESTISKETAEGNLTVNEIEAIGNEITSLRDKLTNFHALNEGRAALCAKEIEDNIIKDVESKGVISQISDVDKVDDDDDASLLRDVNDRPHCSRRDFDLQDEGENLKCKEASNVCNAELLSLTIKYVCYVTNQIKAHFFLLLAFFFVLLLAITTMP